jgi:hypothetical protein
MELLALSSPDTLRAVLADELKAIYASSDEAMSLSERAKKADAITAEIENLEIQEESVIREAAAAGVYIPRRPDADVMTVLGLKPSDLPLYHGWHSEIHDEIMDRREANFENLRQSSKRAREATMHARSLQSEFNALTDAGQPIPRTLAADIEIAQKAADRARAQYSRLQSEAETFLALSSAVETFVKENSTGRQGCMTAAEWAYERARQGSNAPAPIASPFMAD